MKGIITYEPLNVHGVNMNFTVLGSFGSTICRVNTYITQIAEILKSTGIKNMNNKLIFNYILPDSELHDVAIKFDFIDPYPVVRGILTRIIKLLEISGIKNVQVSINTACFP